MIVWSRTVASLTATLVIIPSEAPSMISAGPKGSTFESA